MRHLVPAVLCAAALGACSSAPDDSKVGTLDFYDWIDVRRGEYAAAVDSGETDVQARLAHQMKVQIDRRYDSIVQRAANEQNSWTRELAISALGFSQRPEAVVHIEPHLADALPSVRGTAAAAIGFLNPARAPMEKIEALLNESDVYALHAGLFAIKLLARPDRKPSEAGLLRIQDLAKVDSRFQIRNEAVLALGRILDDRTIETLYRTCLNDESALVRGNAANVLAGFRERAVKAVPALIDRLKDGEPGIVQRAHFALKAITGREDDPSYSTWADWLREQAKVLEFYCPKDGRVRNTPGPCPDCGVNLEPRAIAGAIFVCPTHPEITSQKPGKCVRCQKALLPHKKEDLEKEEQK